MADGRHIEQNKKRCTFAGVWDIFTKFDMHVGLVFPESVLMPNTTYDKIQDGRWPPYLKLINRHNWATIRDISTKKW